MYRCSLELIPGPSASLIALLLVTVCSLPAQSPPSIPKDQEVKTHALTGVQYSILKVGTGKNIPQPGDGALINFSEWLTDGTLLDTTGPTMRKNPIRINVGDPKVPLGLSLGAQLLTKGGKVKLTVPPNRAYGAQGIAGKIPPNATIVYEIELIEYIYRPKQPKFLPGEPAKTVAMKNGVKYQVLVGTAGKRPNIDDIVELEYSIWSLKGEPRGGTYQFGQTVRAPIRGMAHPFLTEILPVMRKGSTWRCVVPESQTVAQINEDSIWQVTLIGFEPSESLPASNPDKSTSTKSGLSYERLSAGEGERPRDGYTCEIEWSFWKKQDKSFVAGSILQKNILVTLDDTVPHKFFPEILKLMKLNEVMRIEVPSKMTTPKMIPFDTIWKINLISQRKPLPEPKFYMPKPAELTRTSSGLQYRIVKGEGRGVSPKMGQMVSVHYVGWMPEGKKFDSSYGRSQPASFELGKVIPGWNEGLQLMKPGQTFLFVIPSKLAYGERGAPGIAPNSTLVFHVELLKVGQ